MWEGIQGHCLFFNWTSFIINYAARILLVKNVTKFAVYEATKVTPAPYHKIAGIRELGARGTFSGLCQKSPANPQNKAFDKDIACLS